MSTKAASSEQARRSRALRLQYPRPALTPTIYAGTSTIHSTPIASTTLGGADPARPDYDAAR